MCQDLNIGIEFCSVYFVLQCPWCNLPWFCQGLWLRQPQISFGQNEVLRSWWCRALDWSIPFWSGLESARRWRTLEDHSNAQAHSCFSFSWTTSQMSSKQWRCSLRMMSKWWPGGHRVWTFTVLLLLHGTGRRNGTYRSILRNATISKSGEKFPKIVFFPQWVWHPHPCIYFSQGPRGSDG